MEIKTWSAKSVTLHSSDQMLDAVKRRYPLITRAELLNPARLDWFGIEECVGYLCTHSHRPFRVQMYVTRGGKETRAAVTRVCPECLSIHTPD